MVSSAFYEVAEHIANPYRKVWETAEARAAGLIALLDELKALSLHDGKYGFGYTVYNNLPNAQEKTPTFMIHACCLNERGGPIGKSTIGGDIGNSGETFMLRLSKQIEFTIRPEGSIKVVECDRTEKSSSIAKKLFAKSKESISYVTSEVALNNVEQTLAKWIGRNAPDLVGRIKPQTTCAAAPT